MMETQSPMVGMRRPLVWRWLQMFALAALAFTACKSVRPFSVGYVDRSVAGASKFPLALDPTQVGTFPGQTKSGAGYFYDEVLEYRVWLHPEKGARRLAGVTCVAFFGPAET